MIISEDSKKKLKADLASYLDHHDQIKEIKESLKDVIKDAADVLEKKPAVVSKAFAVLKKRYEKGSGDLDELMEVVSAFE